jgi:hypothetical protein
VPSTDEEGVTLLLGPESYLRLIPAGPPELGHPVRLQVVSLPFSASVEAEARDIPLFRQQLERLHEKLTGEAHLKFWEAEHDLAFKGDGRGKISLSVQIADGSPKRAWLTVVRDLDQSYLPELIRALGAAFPGRWPGGR